MTNKEKYWLVKSATNWYPQFNPKVDISDETKAQASKALSSYPKYNSLENMLENRNVYQHVGGLDARRQAAKDADHRRWFNARYPEGGSAEEMKGRTAHGYPWLGGALAPAEPHQNVDWADSFSSYFQKPEFHYAAKGKYRKPEDWDRSKKVFQTSMLPSSIMDLKDYSSKGFQGIGGLSAPSGNISVNYSGGTSGWPGGRQADIQHKLFADTNNDGTVDENDEAQYSLFPAGGGRKGQDMSKFYEDRWRRRADEILFHELEHSASREPLYNARKSPDRTSPIRNAKTEEWRSGQHGLSNEVVANPANFPWLTALRDYSTQYGGKAGPSGLLHQMFRGNWDMPNPEQMQKKLDYSTTDIETFPRLAKEVRDRLSPEPDYEAFGSQDPETGEDLPEKPYDENDPYAGTNVHALPSIATPGSNQRKQWWNPNISKEEAAGWLRKPLHRSFKEWMNYDLERDKDGKTAYERWIPWGAEQIQSLF